MDSDVLKRAKALLGTSSEVKSGTKLLHTENEDARKVLNSAMSVLQRSAGNLDVYIAFDTTESMRPYIETVRRNIGVVTDALLGESMRISLNGIADHCDRQRWIQIHKLSDNSQKVKRALESIVIVNGGDIPEAYECLALHLAERIPQESSENKRAVVLVGDSIPHGMPQSRYRDDGCPQHVDYARAFEAMRKVCHGFYFVGCDPQNYDLQRELVGQSPTNRFVPLGSMVEILPQLLVAMAKKTESPKAYSNYIKQLEAQDPSKARKVAGLLT